MELKLEGKTDERLFFTKIGMTQLFLQAPSGIRISGSKMMSEQELQSGQGGAKDTGSRYEAKVRGLPRPNTEKGTQKHTEHLLCLRAPQGRS